MPKYQCVKTCHYGPPGSRVLFQPGDLLPDGWEPGKYFIEVGAEMPKNLNPIFGRGDDPRSTKQMVADLKTKFGIDMEGKTRKEVFAVLRDAEGDSLPDSNEIKASIPDKDPLEGVKFGSMTPDFINSLKRDDIVGSINIRFKLNLTHMGKSKAELVKMGIEYENKQVGALAV